MTTDVYSIPSPWLHVAKRQAWQHAAFIWSPGNQLTDALLFYEL